jgi:hypothetical protein
MENCNTHFITYIALRNRGDIYKNEYKTRIFDRI